MRPVSLLIVCSLVLISSGCSNVRNTPAELSKQLEEEALDKTTLGLRGTIYSYTNPAASNWYLKRYTEAGSEDTKQKTRNEIIYEVMAFIDDDFEEFCRHLRKDKSMKNIWVRIASIGMTTAAALSTGGITNVLAGTDTALKGASEAIDTEAWNNKGPELLIDAMRSQRAKQEVEIYASLTKDTTEYPLSAGLRDLAKYRNIGFVTRALTDLAKDTAQRAKDDEQEAKSAKADPRSALQKLQNLQ